jgi:Tfp pilus assembly protein PilX
VTAAGGTKKRDRGAALVVVVVLAAAFSVAAGALTLFALLEARVATAARDRLAAASAVEAGLELVTAALAAETDYGAVRAGSSTPPPSGTATHRVRGVLVDVASLSRELERRRAALPAPADTGTWRPYLWGRVTELLGDAEADGAHQPWIVAWVRTEEGSGLGPDRLEVAVEARGTGGARAGAVAVVERRAAGAALLAVWPDARFADD